MRIQIAGMTMKIHVKGTFGKVVVNLLQREEPTCRVGSKYQPSNLSLFRIRQSDLDAVPQLSDRKLCAVSDQALCDEASGPYSSDRGAEPDRWSRWTPLERIDYLQICDTSLDSNVYVTGSAEPLNVYEFIHFGIDHFTRSGSICWALLTDTSQKYTALGFALSNAATVSACDELFAALAHLHSLGVTHSNVSYDAVIYDLDMGVFQLSDMFSINRIGCGSPRVTKHNNLYSWLDKRLHIEEWDPSNASVVYMLADSVALLCVLAYMATLDETYLMSTKKAVDGLPVSPFGASTSTSSVVNARLSGLFHLSREYHHTVDSVRSSCLKAISYPGNCSPLFESAFKGMEQLARDMSKIPIGSHYKEHVSYPGRLDVKLRCEPGETRSDYSMRRALSFLYYWMHDREDVQDECTDYMLLEDVICYSSIATAASSVTELKDTL